jgi:hypothetical protein
MGACSAQIGLSHCHETLQIVYGGDCFKGLLAFRPKIGVQPCTVETCGNLQICACLKRRFQSRFPGGEGGLEVIDPSFGFVVQGSEGCLMTDSQVLRSGSLLTKSGFERESLVL